MKQETKLLNREQAMAKIGVGQRQLQLLTAKGRLDKVAAPGPKRGGSSPRDESYTLESVEEELLRRQGNGAPIQRVPSAERAGRSLSNWELPDHAFMSLEEVSAELRMPFSWVLKQVQSGVIKSENAGSGFRVAKGQLRNFGLTAAVAG